MEKTVAAISTPQAAGGIGVIRISGSEAITLADKIFEPTGKKRLCELQGYRAAHGFIKFENEKVDECVALVFRAPRSYTGEDVVELSCHGGLFVLKKVLRALFSVGASPAPAGEFTKRAFLNDKIDLTEAEAVMGIINAQGDEGARASLTALEGALSKKIASLSSVLIGAAAQLCAWVDYPDDDIEELQNGELSEKLCSVKAELSRLLSRFDAGSAITEGVECAIIGKPNVGKSALMNLLSGCNRSIVTDIAGTTRDVVEQTVRLGDVILHLADTAGIHLTNDIVEKIGVEKAVSQIKKAALIFAVFDLSRPLEKADSEILELCKGKRAIAILNKNDLPIVADTKKIKASIPNSLDLCALSGNGIEALEEMTARLLCTNELNTSEAMLTTERQRNDAEKALKSIDEAIEALNSGVTLDAVNVCIDDAINSMLSLTGEKATETVVNEVFSRFCVGK